MIGYFRALEASTGIHLCRYGTVNSPPGTALVDAPAGANEDRYTRRNESGEEGDTTGKLSSSSMVADWEALAVAEAERATDNNSDRAHSYARYASSQRQLAFYPTAAPVHVGAGSRSAEEAGPSHGSSGGGGGGGNSSNTRSQQNVTLNPKP